MITGIAHVCYLVGDLDRAIAFYETLGMKVAFDFTRETGERFGVYLHVGGRGFIELFVGEVDPSASGCSYQHLCLEVDDIDATVAALRDAGIEVSEKKLGSDNSWQAWTADPDGNGIELHGYTPESKQTPHLA